MNIEECGEIIEITDEFDTKVKLRLFCSFSYKKHNYILVKDEEEDLTCREISYNIWKGVHITHKMVPERVCNIANMLLEKAEDNSEFFTFSGEHYLVTKSEKGYVYGKRGRYKWLKPQSGRIPFFVNLVACMLVSVMSAYFYTIGIDYHALTNALNNPSRTTITVIIYCVQIIGAVVLYLGMKYKGNILTCLLCAVVPVQFIITMGLAKSYTAVRILLIITVGVLLAVFAALKTIKYILTKKKDGTKRLCRSAVSYLCCIVIIVGATGYVLTHFFGISIYTAVSDRDSYNIEDMNKCTSEIYDKVSTHTWKSLSTQERLDVLQLVCKRECTVFLGCETPRVVAGYPENDVELGSFDRDNMTVTVNEELIKTGTVDDAVRTILHESRHVYQHAAIESLEKVEKYLTPEELNLSCYQQLIEYRDCFNNYKSGIVDLEEYAEQEIEEDSRYWANGRMNGEYDVIIHLWDSIYDDDETEEGG